MHIPSLDIGGFPTALHRNPQPGSQLDPAGMRTRMQPGSPPVQSLPQPIPVLESQVVHLAAQAAADLNGAAVVLRRDLHPQAAQVLIRQGGKALEDQVGLAPLWTAPAQVTP